MKPSHAALSAVAVALALGCSAESLGPAASRPGFEDDPSAPVDNATGDAGRSGRRDAAAPGSGEGTPTRDAGTGTVPPRDDASTPTTPADAGSDGGALRGPSAVITPKPGANTFDLGQAAAAFAGAKLTFDAAVTVATGADKGSVTLTNLVITNASPGGMRMVRPAFLVEDGAGAVIAATTLTEIDLEIPARRSSLLGRTFVTVEAYPAAARLRLAFGALVASTSTAITGLPPDVYYECKSPQLFTPGVIRHWGVQRCRNCHGGGLFTYTFMGVDDATTCGLNKPLLRAGGPNLLRPSQAGHAGGAMAEPTVYAQAINAWRAGEQ